MENTAKAEVLIIEDDPDIRDGVRLLLESEGYTVQEASCGEDGLALLRPETGLVILDVMMPGMSGLRTCEEIRKVSYVPVLFLTAKTQESDKLIGLLAGGDDYLGKPFSYAELLGRVKALIRRYQVYSRQGRQTVDVSPNRITIGDISINPQYNELLIRGERVALTDIDYRILLLLMQQPGKIFSAQDLFEQVWKEPYLYSSNGTVMVHIRSLRLKIEPDPQNPEHIRTAWGKGYYYV